MYVPDSQRQRSNVVNQWGRDGTSPSTSGRSSGGGILVAALIALVIGGGGGYAGGRFFSGVSSGDIQTRDQKIVELQQALSEMKFDTDGANSQQGALRDRVQELEDQLAAANRLKETMRADTDKQIRQARNQAQAEIDALQKTLDEAGNLNGELGRARKSLKVSELQIIELEKTISEQNGQIKALTKAAEAGDAEAAATLAALKKTNANLRSAFDDAKKQLAVVPRLEDEIATLKEQLSQKSEDADAEARKQIAALQKQLASLQRLLDDALRNAGDADSRSKQIAALSQQVAEMTESLADKDAAVRDTSRQLKQAKSDLSNAEQQINDLKGANRALSDAQSALEKQVATLKAEITRLSAVKSPVDDTPPPVDDTPADDGKTPRDRDDVERAVADMPGYSSLSEARQQTLVDMLESGECVATSLKATYGRVPAVALRNLLRELGGAC